MSLLFQYQFRRDSAANWAAANPVLLSGELGIDSDANNLKLGDGITAWNSLPFCLPRFAEDEVPAGAVDGQNDTFIFRNAPNPPESLKLFNDAGLRLRPQGVDYTLTGNTIVYVAGAIPASGAHHDGSYRF